jgi:hypothetical protein
MMQWKQEVDQLDSALANINIVLDGIAMAIRGLNNGFRAACATGLVPGAPPPLFSKNAFAHQISDNNGGKGDGGTGGGSDHETFPNTMPENLAEEQELAKELGVTPLQVGQPGFDEIINEGPVKWVVTADGKLWIIPKYVSEAEIAHSVIANGGDVIAAGEADIAGSNGQYVGLDITNHSGHYLPSQGSLEIAKKIFESYGIMFP